MARHRGERSFASMKTDTTNRPDADETLGTAFAYAIARHDFGKLGDLLHPDVEFRALTPNRVWEPDTHDATLDTFRRWFGDAEIHEVQSVYGSVVGDRGHVSYRFAGERPDGPFLIEQQAYFAERDGSIDWMRILCSGFRSRA